MPVEITFTHTFLPPPPQAPVRPVDEGPARTAVLRGKLVELGTRAPVTDATVAAVVGERRYSVDADRRGRFRLPLPPGTARVSVYAPSHNPFVQQEMLAAGQELAVSYFVERDRYDPYEIVVVGEQHREEVSRITLRGRELQQIPGTFGDPFRVIQTLPGVASVVSLLPFPVVRGASPASTGFLLDGTTIPLLYHLLVGTSVVHPEFIDEIQFYPGGAPAPYGQYTGGIIDGRTARARPDEHLLDFDLNLLQSGAFVREPIPQLGVTLHGRGPLWLSGVPARPGDQPDLALLLGLPASPRRGERAQRLDGVRLRCQRRARHPGGDLPARQPRSGAHAHVDPGVRSPRSARSPHERTVRRDGAGGPRLRPHLQHGDRLRESGRPSRRSRCAGFRARS